ncbi:MAG: alpha/beta hydrolase-fold protein [Gemmatimonadales bacterium]|nr:alpha/beta hydrolase-fold protein [Gemmatimonadales bacterium]
MRPLVAAVLVLGLGSTGTAFAQSGVRVPEAEWHTLYSPQVGDSFKIRVLLPPMIPGEKTRFPVLYMTDTHSGFAVEDDGLRLMMMSEIPRFISVGIGYPKAPSIMQALGIRARDLTHVPMNDAQAGGALPIEGMLKAAVANGGGPQFLAFIREQLIPFIDAKYPTDPKDRGYWGDSLGGLFGCYVLFTRPETFNRYIIGSPSLWWAGEDMFKVAEQYFKTRGDLPARVFIGVGGLEELPPGTSFRMVTNVLRLERMLRTRNYPGLRLTTRIFPDESHTTVASMNLIRGLVAVYDPPAPGTGLMGLYDALVKQLPTPK